MIKKINVLYAFLLLATTLNSHKMHTMEQPNKEQEESFAFTELPPEMQYYFTKLIAQSSTATTVEEAGKIINALAQTNKELHEVINNPLFCLRVIKNLAQQFACSDQEAAEALQTKEAKHRLEIQKQFLILCQQEDFNEQAFNLLYEQHKEYVDLNFTFYILNPQGKAEITLLLAVAINNNCPAIQTILNHGADINKVTSNGETILMYTSAVGYLDAVQCLLNNPHIIIDQQDNIGTTALMLAAQNNKCPVMRILLSHGADINKADVNGSTALLFAIIYAGMETIQCLLNNPHIAINEQDNNGYTALIEAIQTENMLIIQRLLEAGADPEIATFEGLTPLKAAQQTEDQEIITLIEEAIQRKHEKK